MTVSLEACATRIGAAEAAMPTGPRGVEQALGDVDEILLVLAGFTRRLSAAVEDLPDTAESLRVTELGDRIAPEVVCSRAAGHIQAAAAGIDQTRIAIVAARQHVRRLHAHDS